MNLYLIKKSYCRNISHETEVFMYDDIPWCCAIMVFFVLSSFSGSFLIHAQNNNSEDWKLFIPDDVWKTAFEILQRHYNSLWNQSENIERKWETQVLKKKTRSVVGMYEKQELNYLDTAHAIGCYA